MSQTPIEWTRNADGTRGHTWNPVRGCSRISCGCRRCYAERLAARNLPAMRSPTTGEPFAIMKGDGPHWTGKLELIPSMLDVPLRRKKPTTYFVNSMSDLFHENLDTQARDQIFAVMEACPQHTFQILTKRADLMQKEMGYRRKWRSMGAPEPYNTLPLPRPEFPLPNVWLGVSVEDQQRADERIPLLLQTPAAIRFLSVEPMLGPVDLKLCDHARFLEYGKCEKPHIHWVIVGGESGPGARPMAPEWARSIRDQCIAAGVPFFFKQWGNWGPLPVPESRGRKYTDVPVGNGTCHRMLAIPKKSAGRLLDGRTWDEMPEVRR